MFRYKVSRKDFLQNGLSDIANLYGSYRSAIIALYPDHTFLTWLFRTTPIGFFDSLDNRAKYISWLSRKLGSEPNQLQGKHFLEHNGLPLLIKYGYSPQKIVDSIQEKSDLVEIEAEKAPRKRMPKSHWDDISNQRALLDAIGAKIGVKGSDLSPWYRLSRPDLKPLGCSGLLKTVYSDSIYDMLKAVYPEHEWVPWRFNRFPINAHLDPSVISKALVYIEKERNIKAPEGWYGISETTLKELGVLPLFTRLGGLYTVLNEYRPDYSWNESLFVSGQ